MTRCGRRAAQRKYQVRDSLSSQLNQAYGVGIFEEGSQRPLHQCQYPDNPQKFTSCLKGGIMPVAMRKIGQLMSLLTGRLCQKEFDYLKKKELWESTISRYMKKYARTCKKN
ncbi:uncharacterized protein ACHE_30786A [Aspergillus chevalieri]|uniref:Uncharacterized protein n=1 Tax=Aspergillus chevalieri TaxID=182096 RepID=A0A7R7VMR7_ASPCH|nr:uncharacterized protein ACHE_30786A [Aspergillus chevalieri]BCR86799.1 hypothetical protein ACHE_30786A [Aspergillus chevalieri]